MWVVVCVFVFCVCVCASLLSLSLWRSRIRNSDGVVFVVCWCTEVAYSFVVGQGEAAFRLSLPVSLASLESVLFVELRRWSDVYGMSAFLGVLVVSFFSSGSGYMWMSRLVGCARAF